MPSKPLPLLPGSPTLCQAAEGLDVFLAPLNDPLIQARIGQELVLLQEGSLLITQGEKFRNREGWAQGRRYIRTDDHGTPVAVLNVSIRKLGRGKEAVASNAFTAPDHRRLGLAAGLIERARTDFPQLMADNALSEAGAALVGYAPPAARRRPMPGGR